MKISDGLWLSREGNTVKLFSSHDGHAVHFDVGAVQALVDGLVSAQHTGAVDVVCTPRIGVDGKPSNICVCGRFIVTTTPLT